LSARSGSGSQPRRLLGPATDWARELDGSPDAALIERIVLFLCEIGIEVASGPVGDGSFLPGMTVEHGVLVFDPGGELYPGDLLHEAGHLAVIPPEKRAGASSNLGGDPAEEMMAIAWSYAASVHLGLPPEVVFHEAGYRGGAASMIASFTSGQYLALPMLQWVGMAYDETRAREHGATPYPAMRRWLRDG
jgi:hypothetical protein